MGRAGAFSAAFHPETLDRFRSLCRANGEQYTKVLERLAELYLETDGHVLSAASSLNLSVPAAASSTKRSSSGADLDEGAEDLSKRLERLEENDEYNEETFSTLFNRLDEIEKKLGLGRYERKVIV